MVGTLTPEAVPRLPADRIASEYRRLRRQVFCCVLTMAFTALTLGHSTTSESRSE